jgi:hypothetical protein
VTAGTRTTLVLALASFLVYNANIREISSQDTIPARVLPVELIRYQSLTLDRLFRDWPATDPLPYWVQRVDGHYRSSYPVAPAVLAAPIYLVPMLSGVGDSWVVINFLSKLAASIIAALSVAFVYLAARAAAPPPAGLGGPLAAGLTYAFATSTWSVSSQGLWGHGPAQLALAVALYGLTRSPTGIHCGVVGLAAGFMVASRPSTALAAAILGAYALRRGRRASLWCAVGLFAVLLAVLAYNLATFGSWQGGYAWINRTHDVFHGVRGGGTWSTPLTEGLPGILVSPSRGLLVYSPVLLLCLAGLGWAVWRHGGLFGPAGLIVGATLLLFGHYSVWWGGHSFGPRLLSDLLPAAALGLVPAWPWVRRWGVGRVLAVLLLTWSVGVQAIGAFYYPSARSVDWDATPRDVDQAHERLWDWQDPQLLRLLRNGPVSPGFRTTP